MVFADGCGVAEAPAQLRESLQSVRAQLSRYENHVLEGLADRIRKPIPCRVGCRPLWKLRGWRFAGGNAD